MLLSATCLIIAPCNDLIYKYTKYSENDERYRTFITVITFRSSVHCQTSFGYYKEYYQEKSRTTFWRIQKHNNFACSWSRHLGFPMARLPQDNIPLFIRLKMAAMAVEDISIYRLTPASIPLFV